MVWFWRGILYVKICKVAFMKETSAWLTQCAVLILGDLTKGSECRWPQPARLPNNSVRRPLSIPKQRRFSTSTRILSTSQCAISNMSKWEKDLLLYHLLQPWEDDWDYISVAMPFGCNPVAILERWCRNPPEPGMTPVWHWYWTGMTVRWFWYQI